jgi:hypothetical protein
MSPLRVRSAAAIALLLAGSVQAEERPQLRPTRDVDISYSIIQPNGSKIRERVRWSAGQQLERVDGPDRSISIFDRSSGEITLLVPGSRTYRKLEGTPRGPIEPGKDAVLTRGAESKVAGLRCTDWSWTDNGEKRTLCATPDGVLLRRINDGKVVAQAVSVTYRQQRADLFEIPKGYTPALAPEGGIEP